MSEIPSFFRQFQPPPEPPGPDLAKTKSIRNSSKPESPAQGARRPRLTFSLRDWEFLDYLCEHPNASNGDLAKLFGTTLSAASLRIKRLAKMKLIDVTYETWQDGGVNRRTVNVVHVPQKPWSPDE